jgi:hypothetical protein
MILLMPHVRAALAVALLLYAQAAHGDGGVVQLKQAAGPFIITVFSAPTALRAGPADISVLVQQHDTNEPVLDAEVAVLLAPLRTASAAINTAATRQQATNKLLYAAAVNVPSAGSWELRVTVQHGSTTASVAGTITAAAALPPLLAQWPYLAFPPVAVMLFALHQWLRSRSSNAS